MPRVLSSSALSEALPEALAEAAAGAMEMDMHFDYLWTRVERVLVIAVQKAVSLVLWAVV